MLGACAYDTTHCRSLPQWTTIEKDSIPEGLPWPEDSFQMAVSNYDFHAKRDVTFSARFAPPCHGSWSTEAFEVYTHAPLSPR